jgi:transcriptional regulator with XRE-family HTH domain
MTEALTRYRRKTGLSLDDLAGTLGVDKSTLWRWENGKIPAERVAEVERATSIPRSDLRPDLFEAA